jgi:hypothetical protein
MNEKKTITNLEISEIEISEAFKANKSADQFNFKQN